MNKELANIFNQNQGMQSFNNIKISIASPEQIKSHNTGSLQNFYYLDIIKKNQPKKQSTWLDVCCGSATSSLFISEKFDCLSIGFDLSLKRLQIARQKNEILKTNVEFINADLFHMPFKNDIFELLPLEK